MNIKFTGSFEELVAKLSSLNGEWDEDQTNKKVLRVDGGVLNWFETTGTLSVQGRDPGKTRIEQSVPSLIYPDQYQAPEPEVALEPPTVKKEQVNVDQPSNIDLYLQDKFTETELIIGVVNAVGTESKRVLDPLRDRLRGFGYEVEDIRVSSLLLSPASSVSEYERIKHYMVQGDELRKRSINNAILAAGASTKISKSRNGRGPKVAYVINSLKHPDEVIFLRKVYGNGFYLFGIHADEKRRHDYLVKDKLLSQKQAAELIRIDEDEKISHGQRTRDTFHLADFYINLGKNDDQVKNTIQRFLELLFSNPYRNPTFDEFAMFMAFNSSIRSSDLSRQVGAVITRNQQIIATGANDCPKYGGGQYFAEVDPSTGEVKDIADGKDYMREEDSNRATQNEIIKEISDALLAEFKDGNKEKVSEILKQSKISDLTEFGRVVHAEMEALLSCAREGISTTSSTLYCTTFPCHNCAKHIINAGVTRVVYVEPYPKSRALEFHSESIELKTSPDTESSKHHVIFEPFTGVGVRRFLDLFSMSLGSGSKIRRKDSFGNTLDWSKENATARTPLLPKSYLDIEKTATSIWTKHKSDSNAL